MRIYNIIIITFLHSSSLIAIDEMKIIKNLELVHDFRDVFPS